MKVVFVVNNKNNRLARVLPGLTQACKKAAALDINHAWSRAKLAEQK